MSLKNLVKLLRPGNTLKRRLHSSSTLFSALGDSPNAEIDKTSYDRFMCLPTPECKIQATYVWIDGSGEHLRCKTRTLDSVPDCYKELPTWGYDGSSTMQSHVENSDCTLLPVAMYNDPIMRGNNKLVLCETYDFEEKPTKTNHRKECAANMQKACDDEVMIGFEQEYVLLGMDGRPFGWPRNGETKPAGFYYCGVGGDKVMGRVISESLYRCCLYSGIDIYGTNAEVMQSQWEFQIGTVLGLKAADDLWMARFLVERIAEEFGVNVSYHPKLFPHWSGSGMHTNMSTKKMREEGGYKHVEEAVKKLEKNHDKHMAVYDPAGGKQNMMRLTGKNETSIYSKFSWGVANRSGSVRIPRAVQLKKKGFFEDRRPASNADPYQVLNALVKTCVLNA